MSKKITVALASLLSASLYLQATPQVDLKKDISKFFTRGRADVKSIKILADDKTGDLKNLHMVIGTIEGSPKPFLLIYNKDTIIMGSLIDRKTGQSIFKNFINKNRTVISKELSRLRQNEQKKEIQDNKKLLSLFDNEYKDMVLTIKGGNPKGKTVYLITDPMCPYCQQYEKNELKGTIAKSKEVRVIPIYLNIPGHESSPMRSSWLIEQVKKDKNADIVALMHKFSDKNDNTYKNVDKKFAKKMSAKMTKLISTGYIKGTPTIFDQNGNPTR
jgi:hypothetical protein